MRLTLILGALAATNLLTSLYLNAFAFVALGAGPATDALYASQAIPLFLTALLTIPLRAVIVPLLAGAPPEQFRSGAWSLSVSIVVFAGGLSVLLAAAAPLWVRLLFWGMPPAVRDLTVNLGRIQMIGMGFTLISLVLGNISHAREEFIRVELADFAGSLIAIFLQAWLLPKYGVYAMAWAISLRSAPTALVLAARLRPAPWMSLKNVLRTMRPGILGGLYTKSGFLLDRMLASWAPAGALSVLTFTEKLYIAGMDLTRRTLATPLLSRMAERANAGDAAQFRALGRRGVVSVTVGAAVLLALALTAAGPSFQYLARTGRFTSQNLGLFWHTLLSMGGFLVCGAPATFLSLAFFARHDVKTPTIVTAAAFTLMAVLKVAGFLAFGVLGIAGATSVVTFLSLLVLGHLLNRSLRNGLSPAPMPAAHE